MIATLANYIDINDLQYADTINQLKLLELEIPLNQQSQIVREIFSDLQNKNENILLKQNKEIHESLDQQLTQLKQTKHSYESLDNLEHRNALKQFDEEIKQQKLKMQQPLSYNQTEPSQTGNSIYKQEFRKYIQEQKQLANSYKQVTEQNIVFNQLKTNLLDKIEQQHNTSEKLVQRININIENELKLVEKTTELKIISKLETDLENQFINQEKLSLITQQNPIKNLTEAEFQTKVNNLFTNLFEIFNNIKGQKIKNNDLINDLILQSLEYNINVIAKLIQQQSQNTNNLEEYQKKYLQKNQIEQTLQSDDFFKVNQIIKELIQLLQNTQDNI